MFRYLPLFFVSGAAIELFMIKVRVGKETFCEVPTEDTAANNSIPAVCVRLDDTVVRKEAERRLKNRDEENIQP